MNRWFWWEQNIECLPLPGAGTGPRARVEHNYSSSCSSSAGTTDDPRTRAVCSENRGSRDRGSLALPWCREAHSRCWRLGCEVSRCRSTLPCGTEAARQDMYMTRGRRSHSWPPKSEFRITVPMYSSFASSQTPSNAKATLGCGPQRSRWQAGSGWRFSGPWHGGGSNGSTMGPREGFAGPVC